MLKRAILRDAYFTRARLYQANLERADCRDAHFNKKANRFQAHLENSNLAGADFQDANLFETHLDEANLSGAHLERADFRNAHPNKANLFGARLTQTNLSGANLEGADLRETLGLSELQLMEALGDAFTELPEAMKRPPDWAGTDVSD